MYTDMVLPSEINSHHESIQAQWIAVSNEPVVPSGVSLSQFHALGECPLE